MDACVFYNPSCTVDWWKQEFKDFYLWAYDNFMGGLATLVESIPSPDFLQNMQTMVMPPAVSWFLQPFEIPYALTVIASAYVARFVLRRIPFIG